MTSNGTGRQMKITPMWISSDMDGRLAKYLNPPLLPGEQMIAQVEGWILGVM
jgi:hypothetical protein